MVRVKFEKKILSSGTEKYEQNFLEPVSLSFITKIYYNPSFSFEKIKVSPARVYMPERDVPMKKISILYLFINKPINVLIHFRYIPGTLSAGGIPDEVYIFKIPGSNNSITINSKKIKIERKTEHTIEIQHNFEPINYEKIFSIRGISATKMLENGIVIWNSPSSRKSFTTYIWR